VKWHWVEWHWVEWHWVEWHGVEAGRAEMGRDEAPSVLAAGSRPGLGRTGRCQAVGQVRMTGSDRWPFMMNVPCGSSASGATARARAGKRSNSAGSAMFASSLASGAPRQ
jgi:hypothetical protein